MERGLLNPRAENQPHTKNYTRYSGANEQSIWFEKCLSPKSSLDYFGMGGGMFSKPFREAREVGKANTFTLGLKE